MSSEAARLGLLRVLEAVGVGEIRSQLSEGKGRRVITGLMGPARSLAEAVLATERALEIEYRLRSALRHDLIEGIRGRGAMLGMQLSDAETTAAVVARRMTPLVAPL